MTPFTGRVAIVTGAATGLGRAIAEELGRRGSIVVAADIDPDGARRVAASIRGQGGHASAVPLDVSLADDVRRTVEDSLTAHGRLDYMFNNAGIAVGGDLRDLEAAHWRTAIDVNLWGVIHGSQAAYRVMARQGFGHIVNTASLAGLIPAPGLTPYATTKHAVVGLSRCLRAEGEALGVRATVVCPGFVKTGMYAAATLVNVDRDGFVARIPFRLVPAETAARIILRGVSRNRALIVFPLYARMLWWVNRVSPGWLVPFSRKAIGVVRASRR